MTAWQKFIKEKISPACVSWYHAQCRGASAEYYVAYYPGTEDSQGDVKIFEGDIPAGYILATSEPMSTAKTVDQEIYRLSAVFAKLPILKKGL